MAGRGRAPSGLLGVGGNEDNAIRQNIRAILDNPKRIRGFTGEERQAMEDIVRGTPTQNALRMLGRLSPTTGTIPALAALGAAAVEPTTAWSRPAVSRRRRWRTGPRPGTWIGSWR